MITKKTGTWKIQLAVTINLISCKNYHEEHVMHLKGDKIKIKDGMDVVIKAAFNPLKNIKINWKNKKATINPISRKCNIFFLTRCNSQDRL